MGKLAQAKCYIDAVEPYSLHVVSRRNDYEKALAVYCFDNQEHEKSLELELKLFESNKPVDAADIYKRYYSLYSIYNALNDYDNAYRNTAIYSCFTRLTIEPKK